MAKKEMNVNLSEEEQGKLLVEVMRESSQVPSELKPLLRYDLVKGIYKAEREDSSWHINDNLPSIPNKWYQAMFYGNVATVGVGFLGATGIVAGITGEILFRLSLLSAMTTPIGIGILGMGVVGLTAGAMIIQGDPNPTVGRGQVSRDAWDEVSKKYSEEFKKYWEKIYTKTGLGEKIKSYHLEQGHVNDISIVFNTTKNETHKEIVEDFVVMAVLIEKYKDMQNHVLPHYGVDTSTIRPKEMLKHGVLHYHGGALGEMNRELGRGIEIFPSKEDILKLKDSKDREKIEYVYKVVEYKTDE